MLLVTLWGLPLITPLLRWTAVPCTHDGHLHYHRIAAMRYAWENGLYFSRWLPDLAFGYGYPFFVYREPTPLYASLIPHLLGIPLPAAENLFYIACILGAGWFMYLWVRDILGAQAGLVSAIAYMAAPYLLVDSLIRGNSPESLGLALMPFLLWIGRRWLLRGRWQIFLWAVFGLAFFALSHNISLLLFMPFLFIYLLSVGWSNRVDWQLVGVRLLLFFGLGLGMTSFYTGGALLELDSVTLTQSTNTRNNDFHYNFATLGEIFSAVPVEDPTLLNPPLPFRLGWVPTLLSLLGVGVFLWRLYSKKAERGEESVVSSERHWTVWLMVVSTAVYLLLTLPTTLPLWENLPLIDFVQFPWRFVGRAALPVAFLAGLAFGEWGVGSEDGGLATTRRTPHTAFLLMGLSLLVIETIPNLYPAYCEEEPFPTINTVHRYEHETGLVGVDPEGSYFPVTVEKRPSSSPLESNYQNNEAIARWQLPDGVEALSVEYDNLAAEIRVVSDESFDVQYASFYFPGWTAVIDNNPIDINPSDPEGLITFPVPAGEHTLMVRWQSTPLRSTLAGLSVMALAATMLVAFVLWKDDREIWKLEIRDWGLGISERSKRNTQYAILLAVVILILKLAVFDRTETVFRQPTVPQLERPLSLRGDGLQLQGYNLSRNDVPSGGTFDIDMAWTTVAPPTTQLQTNIWLVDENGVIWSDKETHRPRLYEDVPRTQFWQVGQWGWDSREVALFSGTPAGDYDIVLTLFELETLQPVTLIDVETNNVVGPTAVIGQISVTKPDTQPEFDPQFLMDAEIGAVNAQLLGYNLDRQQIAPGEQFLLTLFWEGNELAHLGDNRAELLLRSDQDNEADGHSWDVELPEVRVDGDRFRTQHLLRIPAHLNSGNYHFVLNDLTTLGEFQIQAPERTFNQPTIQTETNATFSKDSVSQVTLTGYSISNLQSPISLVWQANSEMLTSYRVFIHLVDETGTIVAQADGEPAHWTRPTTGWAVGEFIVDEHLIELPESLPDGELTLRVGLYAPATGERLVTETADFVEILYER